MATLARPSAPAPNTTTLPSGGGGFRTMAWNDTEKGSEGTAAASEPRAWRGHVSAALTRALTRQCSTDTRTVHVLNHSAQDRSHQKWALQRGTYPSLRPAGAFAMARTAI